MKRLEVQLRDKNSGNLYKGTLIKEFDTQFLIVDFETCVKQVELSTYDFDTLFDESYIDFLNRVMA